MRSRLVGLVLAALVVSPTLSHAAARSDATSLQRQELSFKRGQRWAYHNRAGDAGSSLLILKSETLPGVGEIVHVAIEDVTLDDGTGHIARRTIGYLPVTAAALRASVTTLDGFSNDLPQTDQDYREWHAAFAAGQTSPFADTIATVIQQIDDAMRSVPAAGS